MSDDMKCMKAPTIEIRVEKRYVVRVADKKLQSHFRETGHLRGMKELTDERGFVMVVDTPQNFTDLVSTILGEEQEYVKVSLIKASPQIIDEIQERVEAAKAEAHGPVRRPVRRTTGTAEAKGEGGVSDAPKTPPPSEQSKGRGEQE